jgi:hypothetical protein
MSLLKISGTVKDSKTGETLPGVNVYESDYYGNLLSGGKGTSSDVNGKFYLATNIYENQAGFVTAKMLGYKTITNTVIGTDGNVNWDISLSADTYNLPSAVVTAQKTYKWAYALVAFGVVAVIIYNRKNFF